MIDARYVLIEYFVNGRDIVSSDVHGLAKMPKALSHWPLTSRFEESAFYPKSPFGSVFHMMSRRLLSGRDHRSMTLPINRQCDNIQSDYFVVRWLFEFFHVILARPRWWLRSFRERSFNARNDRIVRLIVSRTRDEFALSKRTNCKSRNGAPVRTSSILSGYESLFPSIGPMIRRK